MEQAVEAGMLKHLRRFATWAPVVERAGGMLLFVAAMFFLYQSAAYMGLVIPFQFLFG